MATLVLAYTVGAVVLLACSLYAGGRATKHTRPTYTRRAYAATTYAALLLIWPILFACLVGFDLLRHAPLLGLSLLWPYVLGGLNLAHAHRARDARVHHRSNVSMDVNALSGFCFAIGALLASQFGKQVGVSTSAIFSTALLLCLGFVLPTPEVPEDYTFSVVLETVQQCMLHFAIALLIAGITINLSVSIGTTKRQPTLLQDLLRTGVVEG